MPHVRVLALFSDPPDADHLRLDKEDRILARLARAFRDDAHVDRYHASNVDDIHSIVLDEAYDVIQFSGHGSSEGIYLEKPDLDPKEGELVSAERLVSLIDLASVPPKLAILLSCYSDDSLSTLVELAPFVITSRNTVTDDECLCFVQGLYESLFRGNSIHTAFEHAQQLLATKNLRKNSFRLTRRELVRRPDGLFVESLPDPNRDSILVNLDAVSHALDSFDMTREELCHLLRRKLTIHYWIFDSPRENALIPVGRLLFGQFSWKDARDVVTCTKLVRLSWDVPQLHWRVWSGLLLSYNDLAALEYRRLDRPADPNNLRTLKRALRVCGHNIERYLKPARESIESLGHSRILPHIDLAIAAYENAVDQAELERYPQLVQALELVLTNYHEVVDALQPAEE